MKWNNKKDTIALIDLIIEQKMDLKDYHLLKPIIQKKFMVQKPAHGMTYYFDELLEDIIDWENGNKNSSLEKLISDKYLIFRYE